MYRKSELLETIKTKYNIHKNRKITFEDITNRKNRNKRYTIFIRNKFEYGI